MTGMRLAAGGTRINRQQTCNFVFEGKRYRGYTGDTLASALLANGINVVGRSFKYHRPRGIYAAGAEEPNALMQLEGGAHGTANALATQIELYEGLEARAVNCWPNVDIDFGVINNTLARFLPVGFYYKTFLWPNWKIYEPFIRRAAGLGRVSHEADPDRYETRFAHCDVLVVGSGPAGLGAAQAAAANGARVMLVEQDPILGGSLRWRGGSIDGICADTWIARTEAGLRSAETQILTRTAAMGYFDHNEVVLIESVGGHLGPGRATHLPRQRLWQVRAQRVILACGAIERPLVFCGNDRPGVMLASAVEQYIADFGVRPGHTAVFATNNDSAYASAAAFVRAGGSIKAFIDTRSAGLGAARVLGDAQVPLLLGSRIVSTKGAAGLREVLIESADGAQQTVHADLLAVSGGWTPTVHLHCQSGGRPQWNERYACLVPGQSVQSEVSVGACSGVFHLDQALQQGAAAGASAGALAGHAHRNAFVPSGTATVSFEIEPIWRLPGKGKAFVDLQNDVTADDVALAERENYVSVEHLKRYTTLGMGTDQGKTSNVNALALMAQLVGKPVSHSGVTRYRFPYQPVAFGAFGGLNRGEIFRPLRRLALHEWHKAQGAVFEEYGSWARPAYYLQHGETPHQAEQREAKAVRESVGIFDGSPLGKIEVLGPDAALFLDRIYANTMSNLVVGKCRYGVMLNELGIVIDDGVCARLGDQHFLVGTTSAGATRIAAWLEEWRQNEWPGLEIVIAPVTQCWNVVTLTGPNARNVLKKVGVDFDLNTEAFPHLSWVSGHVGGADARVFRVSYTGEVSFEINVAPSAAEQIWTKCWEAGQEFDIAPIGIDGWMVLRTERGFLHVGADTDGTTTALDIGLGRILKRKGDFIGRRSLMRPADQREDRLNFVGIEPVNDTDVLRVGLPVLAHDGPKKTIGYVTSAVYSPTLGCYIALGMIENGRMRIGETIVLAGSRGPIEARIAQPGAFDPKGQRVHG